jgi:hypothetical protein
MPAQRSLSSAAPTAVRMSAARAAGALIVVALAAGCKADRDTRDILIKASPDTQRVAIVRASPCGDGWCESLWVGQSSTNATRVTSLTRDREHCDAIVWTADGRRVGFLIDGYQLRIYDAQTMAPAGLVALVEKDGTPTTRIARGVTFSDNGAAVTFDDCPREKSGCRPGLVGIR